MSDSKFPDENIFKRVFRFICKIWIWISVIVMILTLSVWFIILIAGLQKYSARYGFRHQTDNVYWYGGSPYCGYADQTPFPKHLGGVTFSAFFYSSMIIWILLSICSEMSWMGGVWRRVLAAFRLRGLYSEEPDKVNDHVIVNAMLKFFIVAATGAQSWVGVNADERGVQTDNNLEQYCLYVTFMMLVNVPLSIIAQMYYCPEEVKARKAAGTYA